MRRHREPATDLLEQADHLCRRERQRPKQASLRRSISSPYYALFHPLTSECVTLIGPNLTAAARHRIQRWFDHHEMKRVCGMFSAPLAPRQLSAILGAPVSPAVQRIARIFDARIDADYNLAVSFSRPEALQYVLDAREAFAAWTSIRRTHEANVFAIALLSSKLVEKER